LRAAIGAAGVTPLAPLPPDDPARVALGRALFFDKELSGNRNIGCSTCHNPAYHTSDQLMLSIGTGGTRPGGGRLLGSGAFTARNATEMFNRGRPDWRVLLADGSVSGSGRAITTPFGAQAPANLDGLLAGQALLPLVARGEMRGHAGDLDALGEPNELALLPDSEPAQVWSGIMTRLRRIPGYDSLFAAAYPNVPADSLGIADAVNAIAVFIRTTWSSADSPFDRYLAGDSSALSDSAWRGASLFFGRARCAECHRGPLLSDQDFHNTGVPPLGPGTGGGPDIGRGDVTGFPEDRFRFRTPALRNVSLTAPYMHNGAFHTFESIIRHYRDAAGALRNFDPLTVDARLRPTLQLDPVTVADVLGTLDPRLQKGITLSDRDMADLVAFLFALTDQSAANLLGDVPRSVPSGLPVLDR
jgi:cytochrome c peroxidase